MMTYQQFHLLVQLKLQKIVYQMSTQNLKRCIALGGAKNHLIVLPDADKEMASDDILASMSDVQDRGVWQHQQWLELVKFKRLLIN